MVNMFFHGVDYFLPMVIFPLTHNPAHVWMVTTKENDMNSDFNRRRQDFDRSFKRMEKIVFGTFIVVGVVIVGCISSGVILAIWGASNLAELGEYLIRLKSA